GRDGWGAWGWAVTASSTLPPPAVTSPTGSSTARRRWTSRCSIRGGSPTVTATPMTRGPTPSNVLRATSERDHAIIESAKIRGYLLSSKHPVGRFKARDSSETFARSTFLDPRRRANAMNTGKNTRSGLDYEGQMGAVACL